MMHGTTNIKFTVACFFPGQAKDLSASRYDPNLYDCLFQVIISVRIFQPRFCMCHSSCIYMQFSSAIYDVFLLRCE